MIWDSQLAACAEHVHHRARVWGGVLLRGLDSAWALARPRCSASLLLASLPLRMPGEQEANPAVPIHGQLVGAQGPVSGQHIQTARGWGLCRAACAECMRDLACVWGRCACQDSRLCLGTCGA